MSMTRRRWLQLLAALSAAALRARTARASGTPSAPPEVAMGFGLVTYQWGRDWDLPTLIERCQTAGLRGVELRTTHAHGVEPSLNEAQREQVKQRFADSHVQLVGIGSDERFDHTDRAVLQRAVETAKAFLRLSHDVGGTGVKVKPDSFHPDVPHEKTIEQIGRALNELGEFGAGYGQQVRLEVHGSCAELPTIKAILDVAQHENVAICWNCNRQDLQGAGLEANFRLVRSRFGGTLHVHELDRPNDPYPYAQLVDLLVATSYDGWVLLEASSQPEDRGAAMVRQLHRFQELTNQAVRRQTNQR